MTLVERTSIWTSRLVYLLVALLVFLPPLIIEVRTAETFKVTQECLVVVLGWAVILTVAVSRALAGLPVLGGGQSSWARWALGGLAAWIILSSAFAFNPESAWRYAATVLSFLLVGQSLLDWVEMKPERRGFVLAVMTAMLGLQVMFGLTQAAKWPYLEWSRQAPEFLNNGRAMPWSYLWQDFLSGMGVAARDGRPIGTIGNVNYMGEYLALMLPVALGWAVSFKRLWPKVAIGILVLAGFGVLVVTGARAAMVGMLVASLIATVAVLGGSVLDPRRWWSTPKGKVLVGVVAVVAIAGSLVVGGRIAAKFETRSGLEDSSIASREANWQAALAIAKEDPLTGDGIGSYKLRNVAELAELYPEGLPESAAKTRFLQAHNEPLQGMAELGFVGFLIALAAFVFWCRETTSNSTLARPLQIGLVGGVGGLMLAGLFGFPLHIPLTSLMLMFVLAMGLAARQPNPEASMTPVGRVVYALVALVIAGAAGYMVIVKDIAPLYTGHRYLYVAEKVAAKESSDTTLATLALADRFDRYRGAIRWKILKTMVANHEYESALKLWEGSAREGLGADSLYWKARALQELGRYKEAHATYNQMVHYYPKSHAMNKRAKRAMRSMEVKGQLEDKPAT